MTLALSLTLLPARTSSMLLTNGKSANSQKEFGPMHDAVQHCIGGRGCGYPNDFGQWLVLLGQFNLQPGEMMAKDMDNRNLFWIGLPSRGNMNA